MNIKLLSFKRSSYNFAYYIAKIQKEAHTKRAVYYYGFQVIIGTIVELFVITIVAWFLGVLIQAVLTSIVFVSIRSYSGGYHAKTYTKCLFHTLFIILGISFASKFFIELYSSTINAAIFLLIFYITYKNAPKDNPNNPIVSNNRRKNLKIKALFLNFLWFIISVSLLITNSYIKYTPIIGLTALIEAFTLTSWYFQKAPIIENLCAKPFCHNYKYKEVRK